MLSGEDIITEEKLARDPKNKRVKYADWYKAIRASRRSNDFQLAQPFDDPTLPWIMGVLDSVKESYASCKILLFANGDRYQNLRSFAEFAATKLYLTLVTNHESVVTSHYLRDDRDQIIIAVTEVPFISKCSVLFAYIDNVDAPNLSLASYYGYEIERATHEIYMPAETYGVKILTNKSVEKPVTNLRARLHLDEIETGHEIPNFRADKINGKHFHRQLLQSPLYLHSSFVTHETELRELHDLADTLKNFTTLPLHRFGTSVGISYLMRSIISHTTEELADDIGTQLRSVARIPGVKNTIDADTFQQQQSTMSQRRNVILTPPLTFGQSERLLVNPRHVPSKKQHELNRRLNALAITGIDVMSLPERVAEMFLFTRHLQSVFGTWAIQATISDLPMDFCRTGSTVYTPYSPLRLFNAVMLHKLQFQEGKLYMVLITDDDDTSRRTWHKYVDTVATAHHRSKFIVLMAKATREKDTWHSESTNVIPTERYQWCSHYTHVTYLNLLAHTMKEVEDKFEAGLRTDLNTGSLDALFEQPDILPPMKTSDPKEAPLTYFFRHGIASIDLSEFEP